jgi:two-component system, response regulator PdtaR
MPKAKIMIVEDEPLVALEIRESLERMGYSVPEVVDSGDEVLAAAQRSAPDLVIMDVHLKSFTDGIDAAQRLRLLGDIPVIYMTAYSNAEIRERAQRTEPAAYLLKPLSDEELQHQVEAVLLAK